MRTPTWLSAERSSIAFWPRDAMRCCDPNPQHGPWMAAACASQEWGRRVYHGRYLPHVPRSSYTISQQSLSRLSNLKGFSWFHPSPSFIRFKQSKQHSTNPTNPTTCAPQLSSSPLRPSSRPSWPCQLLLPWPLPRPTLSQHLLLVTGSPRAAGAGAAPVPGTGRARRATTSA